MKIIVCIRQSANGEINPFDASAYETALNINNAEITLLSMGPLKTKPFLEELTRLGAEKAVLLSDKVFAGADTLATSYTLSLMIKRLEPQLVICGRQSVDGDTGQVGPALAELTDRKLVTNVMEITNADESGIACTLRSGENAFVQYPALITVEKSRRLRLPGIRSKTKETEVLDAESLGADISRCGLSGSPTRVIKTYENNSDRRRCKFIELNEINAVIASALEKGGIKKAPPVSCTEKLKNVWTVGKAPYSTAQTVAENITVAYMDTPDKLAEKIRSAKPDAVLWASDSLSKATAPRVAVLLNTGLCADCTALESDGETLFMYRPACSGSITAKIKCITRPPMATVRTPEDIKERIIIGLGYGAENSIKDFESFAEKTGAGIAATRKAVDNDLLPYEKQAGLTGKTVNPDVYIAVGISGAVHHITGIRNSGTIIAVNTDKEAPIFDYADYGVICTAEELIKTLNRRK